MKQADVVLVGGGSGGHITPLVSVAEALKKADPERSVAHIGHKNDPLNEVTERSPEIDHVYQVSAGKFRRYYTDSTIKKLVDVKTNALNVRDFFRFTKGVFQAWRLLGKLQPRVIFMKGGYVCANVGYAAQLRGIPYITHDSDAMVSLAHKIIGKKAALHLTALPPEYYPEYEQSKTKQVGVPIKAVFKKVDKKVQVASKTMIGVPEGSSLVLVTGGGLGAQNMNYAVLRGATELVKDDKIYIVLLTGKKLYEKVLADYEKLPNATKAKLRIESFTHDMETVSAAADLVVSRASMTALTEFGVQSKACLVVPNPLLAGGHQLKNADALIGQKAAAVVSEEDFPKKFPEVVRTLLQDDVSRELLGQNLHESTISDAATRIAVILDDVVRE